ncbi:MAG: hypothetical protein K9H13_00280 [Bacteroidales bacterium]|nr:hypothetical protein [Bacteroidales bacterium]
MNAFFLDFLIIALSLAFVLWGLRVFKIYIVLFGIFLGMIGGVYLMDSIEPFGNQSVNMLTGAVVGGLIGGLLAWPLQKVIVFIIAGFLMIIFGMSGLQWAGWEWSGNWYIFTAAFFLLGGIISVWLYDYLIIVIMTITAVHNLFRIFIKPDIYFQPEYLSLEILWEKFLDFYTDNYFVLLFMILIYLFYALYYQKWLKPSERKEYQWKMHKGSGKLFAILILIAYASDYYFSGIIGNSAFHIAVDIFTWPLLAFLFGYVFVTITVVSRGAVSGVLSFLLRYFFTVVSGLLLIPLFRWVISTMLTDMNFDLTYIFDYFRFFIGGPTYAVIGKWVYSLMLFPLLTMLFVFRRFKKAESYSTDQI